MGDDVGYVYVILRGDSFDQSLHTLRSNYYVRTGFTTFVLAVLATLAAGLSLFSLLYFGFYREGCVCAIGSVQNVALALFDSSYALPWVTLVFLATPSSVSLKYCRRSWRNSSSAARSSTHRLLDSLAEGAEKTP